MKNKKVAVVGFGITGQAVVRYLTKKSAAITVFDGKEEKDFDQEILNNFSDVEFKFGSVEFEPTDFDLIVVSPGVPLRSSTFKKAFAANIPVHNDITLFIEEWKKIGPVVGVTGSNGKSTVVSLAYECLKDQKPTILAGNIGDSPLDQLDQDHNEGTVVVLELSSYQLELFEDLDVIDIFAITNISRNHLDRYGGSIEKYALAKMNGIGKNTKVIVNVDDSGTRNYVLPNLKSKNVYLVSLETPTDQGIYTNETGDLAIYDQIVFGDIEKRKLVGTHNLYNIAFVLMIVNLLNLDPQKCDDVIRDFKGLEHRIEFVREIDGVKYFNDTKSTCPEPTIAALDAVGDSKNVILIAGGNDKDLDLSVLEMSFDQYVKNLLVLPGEVAQKLKKVAEKGSVAVGEVSNMKEAVEMAKGMAVSGDSVLLSPAATSFSQYKNFEERGKDFKDLVNKL